MVPLRISIELVRTTDTFEAGVQNYRLRKGEGAYRSVSLDWDAELGEALRALHKTPPDGNVLQLLGRRLRDFLDSAGWDQEESAIVAAVREQRPVRITLRFAAPELVGLPWEVLTLRATGQHVGALPDVLIRHEAPETSTAPLSNSSAEGGRVVLAWSGAGGSIPLEEHRRALADACARAGLAFVPERDVVELVSPSTLDDLLRRSADGRDPVRAVHLLCHGQRTASGTRSFGLALGTREAPSVVDADGFSRVLQEHVGQLRLLVLCACHGSDVGLPGSPLGSVAHAAHRVGVASVVASAAPLSKTGSVELARAFYDRLLVEPASVERAYLGARAVLAKRVDSVDWAILQMFARERDGEDARPIAFCPFMGLRSFDESDARFYVDVGDRVPALLSRLTEAREGRRPRFQILTGPSGSGKSSLVRAGLIPRIRAMGWRSVVRRGGALTLDDIEQEWASATADAPPLLFVVDQLEEVFAAGFDARLRQGIVERLAAAPDGVVALATLRADYLPKCQDVVLDAATGLRLDRALFDEQRAQYVGSPKLEDLPRAIAEPAAKVGIVLEDGLVQRVLDSAEEGAGVLPLLEHALELLWRRRDGATLTHAAWDALLRGDEASGGGRRGLERVLIHVAETLHGELDARNQRAYVERIFLQLVDLGEGTAQLARRAIWLDEWRPEEAHAAAAFDVVVERMIASRLVVASQEGGRVRVEVAHGALLQRWQRLHTWIDARRRALSVLQEVRRRRARAERLPLALLAQSFSALRDSPELAEAALRSYVRGSALRLLLLTAAVLLGATAVGTIIARQGNALSTERERNQDALLAEAVVRASSKTDPEDPLAAREFLLEIKHPANVPEWRGAAWELLHQPLPDDLVTEDEFPSWYHPSLPIGEARNRIFEVRGNGVTVHRKGLGDLVVRDCTKPYVLAYEAPPRGARWLPVSCERGAKRPLRIVDLVGGTPDRELADVPVDDFEPSPDQTKVITMEDIGDGAPGFPWSVVDLEAAARLHLEDAPARVKAAHFANDSHVVALAANALDVSVWDLANHELTRLEPGPGELDGVVASSDATSVAAAASDGSIVLWRLPDPVPVTVRVGRGGIHEVDGLEFDASGTRLMARAPDGSGGSDTEVRVWDVDDPARSVVLGEREPATRVVAAPFAELVALDGDDWTTVWRLDQPIPEGGSAIWPDPVARVRACNDRTEWFNAPLVWSPGGDTMWMYCGTVDTLVGRNPYARVVRASKKPALAAIDAVVTKEGRVVITSSEDGVTRTDVDAPESPAHLDGPGAPPSKVLASSDGRTVVGVVDSSHGDEVWAWQGDEKRAVRVADALAPQWSTLALRPDGSLLASCGDDAGDAVLVLADPASRSRRTMRFPRTWCGDVAFSPAGHWLVLTVRDDRDAFDTERLWIWPSVDLERGGAPASTRIEAVSAGFEPGDAAAAWLQPDGTLRMVSPAGEERAVKLPLQVSDRNRLRDTSIAVARGGGSFAVATRAVAHADGEEDRGVTLFVASPGQDQATRVGDVGVTNESPRAAFTPDGRDVLLSGSDTKVWSVGDLRAPPGEADGSILGTYPAPDGSNESWLVTYRDGSATSGAESFFAVWKIAGVPPSATRIQKYRAMGHPLRDSSSAPGPWLVAGARGARFAFPLFDDGIPYVREKLRAATTACLLPRQRIDYLGQDVRAAEAAYASCRNGHRERPWLEEDP